MGKRLGRFITHYRNTFFRPDKRNGQVVFSYKPLPGAEEQIYDAISDITISMKAVDHLDMPECVHNDAIVTLSETERKAYDAMKQDLVISLKGEEIDAGNAAALANKLSQMANGAVYGEDKRVFQIHDRKLQMGNPYLWRTGSSTTWSTSPSGSTNDTSRSVCWTIPTASADGTAVSCPWHSSTRLLPVMG